MIIYEKKLNQGIPCECKYNICRKKFGVAGLSKNDEKDTQLMMEI